ncbi:MAG TPA: asparagine synthetase B, partial [Acidimicrobiaceae bacterium]|nr:asparagine synthetase B [Acidimicrobiaceae bacterium]
GFGVPLDDWLRGPLREWAADTLASAARSDAPAFDPALVDQAWREHQKGRRLHTNRLWTVLQFEAWRQHWT